MPEWETTREIKTTKAAAKKPEVITVEKPKTIKIGEYEVPLWMPAFVGGIVLTKFLEK